MELGVPELVLILVILLLLFGVGRISKIGEELGQGLKEFRHGLQNDEERLELSPQPVIESEHQSTGENEKTPQ